MLFEVTDKDESDGQVMPELLQEAPASVTSVFGDGAYDTQTCYQAILDRHAKAIIPPRRNGVCRSEAYFKSRTAALKVIEGLVLCNKSYEGICHYLFRLRFDFKLPNHTWLGSLSSLRSGAKSNNLYPHNFCYRVRVNAQIEKP